MVRRSQAVIRQLGAIKTETTAAHAPRYGEIRFSRGLSAGAGVGKADAKFLQTIDKEFAIGHPAKLFCAPGANRFAT